MADNRISVRGKYFFLGERKFYMRGVTYGTFGPNDQDLPFPPQETVERDFEDMAASRINAVRVYTPPPRWLLDVAWKYGLYVMVGLPWEQHIAFLDNPDTPGAIEKRVRLAVRELSDHPAILCYVVGNEIPASIVRWHGAQRIEHFIKRLYKAVKAEAPDTLVTYVNFPTTEYLHLPFLDFLSFNVYLETQEKLDDYIAQLQNQAGDRPLILAEVGLDSRRNGEIRQSKTLAWQIRTIFAAGCAGMFVFAWTDEWYRGGHEIEDWDFGLTRRDREPKPALEAVRLAFGDVPFPAETNWPEVSVIVCTHNGGRTLRDCLDGLKELEYPRYEVIVVDDGSTDDTAAIAQEYDVKLIQSTHQGLAAARNIGMDAAKGEIIAYTDDDARPDPHWLQYLAWTFLTSNCAAAGGPNIPPPGDGRMAECVANAPGGPIHVLVTDRDAEHIPGCNSAFRKSHLAAIGGFDPRFRSAGDDVDVCWRILDRGWKIRYHAGAMVWHHRRSSFRSYWTQQRGYGRAEGLLEVKWPSKYNSSGNVVWSGRLYGRGILQSLTRGRIYHGIWGSAPFQRLYTPADFRSPLLMIEWHLAVLLFAAIALSASNALFLFIAVPLAVLVLGRLMQLVGSVADTPFVHHGLRVRFGTVLLHIVQPIARLWGRIEQEFHQGKSSDFRFAGLRRQVPKIWSEQWKAPEEWLHSVESALLSESFPARRGGDYETWDLETRSGVAGVARLKLAVEEHGSGKQMLLFEIRPVPSRFGAVVLLLSALFSALAFWGQHVGIGGLAALAAVYMIFRVAADCSSATAAFRRAVEGMSRQEQASNESVTGVVYLGSSL